MRRFFRLQRGRGELRNEPPALEAILVALTSFLLIVLVGSGTIAAHPSVAPRISSDAVENISVMATGSLSFQPDQLTVTPGALVHLTVLQAANFDHTFTLSPVANLTIPAGDTTAELYAFFNAHTPLVNLSLGSTPGAQFFANFTAPAVGTYEFVCLIHFQQGMTGKLISGTSSSGASNSFPLSPVYIGIVVVVLLVIVAVVIVATRRRKSAQPPAESPPPKPTP